MAKFEYLKIKILKINVVNTIIFDLAEVYLKGLIGVEYHLESLLGMRYEEIYHMIRGKELTDLFCGKITEEEYWEKISRSSKEHRNGRIF